MASGNRTLTRELYDSLVEGFREAPGNGAHAARRAGTDRRMARRGWDLGWKNYPWARPIKLVLADEANLARARVADITRQAAEEADRKRDAAKEEHVKTLAEEQQILKVARGDVLGALVLAAELVPAMRHLAKRIIADCQPQPDGSPPLITAAAAMQLMARHATLVQKAVGAAEAVVQLSRLDRGQPGTIVGVKPTAPELTYAEALEELEAAESLLGVARKGGLAPGPEAEEAQETKH